MSRLTIGKVAKRTGCNIETIRYYEKEGLLPSPNRTEGGHRLYTEDMIKRLVFIRRARQLGFTMMEIRQLFKIVDGDHVSCERVKTITDIHIQDIKYKIKDLKKMDRILTDLSNKCSGDDIPECPIIDVLQSAQFAPNISQ